MTSQVTMDNGTPHSALLATSAPADLLEAGVANDGGPAPGSPGTATGRLATRLRSIWGDHSLGLADQAVVSGANFVTTVLVARSCGASELGIYSIGFSLLIATICLQDSLIATPYNIFRHRPLRGTPAELAGSVLLHNAILSAFSITALLVLGLVLSINGAASGLVTLCWVLAGVVPFSMLREFGRRFAFAHLRVSQVFVLDLAVAALQLGGLGTLALTGRLTAASAYLVIGVSCGIAGSAWLLLARSNFALAANQVWPTVKESWRFGSWFGANQVTVLVQSQMLYWLLAWAAGTVATGIFAACITLIQFANPIILGFGNTLLPKTAQAFRHGGAAEMKRVVLRSVLLLGSSIAVYCAIVMVFHEQIMRRLYLGDQYQGHGHVIVILALALLTYALGIPATQALASIERPEVVFKATCISLGISVVLIPVLILAFGLTGAAYGNLVANLISTVGRWVGFFGHLPRDARLRSEP